MTPPTVIRLMLFSLLLLGGAGARGEAAARPEPEQNARELIAFPGPWEFGLPRDGAILVRDEQLEQLTNPDQEVDLGISGTPNVQTWRRMCENAKARGVKTILIAFDHFFAQYQKGQGDKPRTLTPDRPEYIELIGKLSQFAKDYGVGLELSVLSPLEIGPGYQAETGESGIWMQYRKGLRDPQSGAYDVQLWRQKKWSNNKGPIALEDAGVRVFAFREAGLPGVQDRLVPPDSIVELPVPEVEILEGQARKYGDFEAVRIRVHGAAPTEAKELDRVLVVQQYRVPEMDYFSDGAAPYLKGLIDRYADAGVILNGLYSDEMHIQQDWGYGSHLENGEFALKYVSPGLAARFAEKYGEQYRDFAKWLVYFVQGQEDASLRTDAKAEVRHVWSREPAGAREAALFRARYYHLLQDGVVDLFTTAKHYAEGKMGHRLQARAHATWAQSPTIDTWGTEPTNMNSRKYEYTPDFVRSNTVQQASAACADYFKWGDFLTGNGTDHPEGGWLDRDYYGLALAASIGVLNEVPYAYCAHWGMPDEISRRRQHVVDAYGGNGGIAPHTVVQEMQHRDTEVLMLYPLDLVAVDEKYGSWMAQYGYANYITQAKLLERGQVKDGAIEVAGRRYPTLCTLFEPFPQQGLLEMMQALAEQGGRVVWSGPPPVLGFDGAQVLPAWEALFGVDYTPLLQEGLGLPGRQTAFSDRLANVPREAILSAGTVDRVYPVAAVEGTRVVTRVQEQIVGTYRETAAKGSLTFLGFRPRDDQSQSLGFEVGTWYAILRTLGAYPGSAAAPGDNPAAISRESELFAARFPNGTFAFAPHLRTFVEDWGGGFVRKAENDQRDLAGRILPPENLNVVERRIAGHTLSYSGVGAVSVRPGVNGSLLAFAGQQCTGVTLDGVTTSFAEQPLAQVCFAPVPESRRVPGGAVYQLLVAGGGAVHVPAAGVSGPVKAFAEGGMPGAKGAEVPVTLADGVLSLSITPEISGRWIYVTPAQ